MIFTSKHRKLNLAGSKFKKLNAKKKLQVNTKKDKDYDVFEKYSPLRKRKLNDRVLYVRNIKTDENEMSDLSLLFMTIRDSDDESRRNSFITDENRFKFLKLLKDKRVMIPTDVNSIINNLRIPVEETIREIIKYQIILSFFDIRIKEGSEFFASSEKDVLDEISRIMKLRNLIEARAKIIKKKFVYDLADDDNSTQEVEICRHDKNEIFLPLSKSKRSLKRRSTLTNSLYKNKKNQIYGLKKNTGSSKKMNKKTSSLKKKQSVFNNRIVLDYETLKAKLRESLELPVMSDQDIAFSREVAGEQYYAILVKIETYI